MRKVKGPTLRDGNYCSGKVWTWVTAGKQVKIYTRVECTLRIIEKHRRLISFAERVSLNLLSLNLGLSALFLNEFRRCLFYFFISINFSRPKGVETVLTRAFYHTFEWIVKIQLFHVQIIDYFHEKKLLADVQHLNPLHD